MFLAFSAVLPKLVSKKALGQKPLEYGFEKSTAGKAL